MTRQNAIKPELAQSCRFNLSYQQDILKAFKAELIYIYLPEVNPSQRLQIGD